MILILKIDFEIQMFLHLFSNFPFLDFDDFLSNFEVETLELAENNWFRKGKRVVIESKAREFKSFSWKKF